DSDLPLRRREPRHAQRELEQRRLHVPGCERERLLPGHVHGAADRGIEYGAMAQRKDLLSRLADAGEEALNRLGDAPGMDRVTAFANSTRDRLDELTRRVRGIEALEERVAKLERQVATLSGTKRSPARKTSTTRKRSPTTKA